MEIKRAKRMNKAKTRSEVSVAIHQIKDGVDGLTGKFYELIDMNLALQAENEQLRVALQNAQVDSANTTSREKSKTVRGENIK